MKGVVSSAAGLVPRDDESLDSFLTRWSAHQGTDVAHAIDGWPDADSPRGMQALPTSAFLKHASAAMQVPMARLRAMTTAQAWVDGAWVQRSQLAGVLQYPGRRQWTPTDTSPVCPRCLQEAPEWRLAWRMPWISVCPTHQLLLVDSCPTCQKPLHVASRRLPPSRSPRKHQHVTAYDHDFCQAATAMVGETVDETDCSVQDLVEEYLRAHTRSRGEPGISRADEVRSLASLALSLATAGQASVLGDSSEVSTRLAREAHLRAKTRFRWAKRGPIDSGLRHLALRASITEVQAARTGDIETPLLRALDDLDLSGAALTSWILDHSYPTPLVQRIASLASERRGRVGQSLKRARQQALDLFALDPATVPQLFWPCSAPTFLMTNPGKPSHPMRLAFLSLCLVRLATGDWMSAAEELGYPPDRGVQWSRYVIGSVPKESRSRIGKWSTCMARGLAMAPVASRTQVANFQGLSKLKAAPCRREDRANWCPCDLHIEGLSAVSG